MSEQRQMHPCTFLYPEGHHQAAWRTTASETVDRIYGLSYYREPAEATDAAANFGDLPRPAQTERYLRAPEFVEVVTDLRKGRDPDAVVADSNTGQYADTNKIEALRHSGRYLSIHTAPSTFPVSPRPASSGANRHLTGRSRIRSPACRDHLHSTANIGLGSAIPGRCSRTCSRRRPTLTESVGRRMSCRYGNRRTGTRECDTARFSHRPRSRTGTPTIRVRHRSHEPRSRRPGGPVGLHRPNPSGR